MQVLYLMKSGEAQKPAKHDPEIRDRIRKQWFSNVVHDFSNPLFAARGYLRLVLEERDGPLIDSQRRYVTAALENVAKLVALTRELDDFQEMDRLELGIVSFRSLLPATVKAVRANLIAQDVVLTERMSDGSLSTIGDAKKLEAAVCGFLFAAVEFTGPSGSVHTEAREENGKIFLEFSTIRKPGTAPPEVVPDTSVACRMWRLHGGSCSFGTGSDGGYLVSCELPILRLPEC